MSDLIAYPLAWDGNFGSWAELASDVDDRVESPEIAVARGYGGGSFGTDSGCDDLSSGGNTGDCAYSCAESDNCWRPNFLAVQATLSG